MGLKQGNGRKERRNERRHIERELDGAHGRWPIQPRTPPPDRPVSPDPDPQKHQEVTPQR